MIIKLDSGDLVITGADSEKVTMLIEKEKMFVVVETNSLENGPVVSPILNTRTKPLDSNDVNLGAVKNIVDEYARSESKDCIEISDMTRADRHQLHIYAAIKGLNHWSSGNETNRLMCIQKK